MQALLIAFPLIKYEIKFFYFKSTILNYTAKETLEWRHLIFQYVSLRGAAVDASVFPGLEEDACSVPLRLSDRKRTHSILLLSLSLSLPQAFYGFSVSSKIG